MCVCVCVDGGILFRGERERERERERLEVVCAWYPGRTGRHFTLDARTSGKFLPKVCGIRF